MLNKLFSAELYRQKPIHWQRTKLNHSLLTEIKFISSFAQQHKLFNLRNEYDLASTILHCLSPTIYTQYYYQHNSHKSFSMNAAPAKWFRISTKKKTLFTGNFVVCLPVFWAFVHFTHDQLRSYRIGTY